MTADFFLFPTMGKSAAGSTQISVQGVQSLTIHLPVEESFRLSGAIPHSFIRPHIVVQQHNNFVCNLVVSNLMLIVSVTPILIAAQSEAWD
jgi:hypothetical protein